MRDRSARRRERLASNAGIAEQVQKGGIGRVRNPFAQPVPYRRHIGKKAQMPERRATCRNARLAPAERPAFGGHGLMEIPAPAAILVRRRTALDVGPPPIAPGPPGPP